MDNQAKMSYPATAALYVGDLTDDVSETILYEIFSQPAPVASIRICRDSQTGRSLGYGYVNYHTVPDAERALDVLNFTRIKGRPCRVMWKNADKLKRQLDSSNNVFVKNLDKEFDNKALHDTFSLFGNIISCKVATDTQGRSLGHGFVQYEKEESLVDAITRVNGMKIGKNKVFCGRFKRKEDRESLRDSMFYNIYAKGIPAGMPEEKIRVLFEEFGKITSFAVKYDSKGRPFCYVNYGQIEEAPKAVEVLHGRLFNVEFDLLTVEETAALDEAAEASEQEGQEYSETPTDTPISTPKAKPEVCRFYVQRHESRAERDLKLKSLYTPTRQADDKDKSVVLYTRHFPDTYTEKDLSALFEKYGMVNSVKIAKDDHGKNRGFAFVCFAEHADAQKALLDLNDKPISENFKLYVSYLEPKDVRTQRLKAQLTEKLSSYTTSPTFPHNKPFSNSRAGGHKQGDGRGGPRSGQVQTKTDEIAEFKARLEDLTFSERKQAIGDHLYHRIVNQIPGLAGKVTGMMLEMENEVLLRLIGNETELQQKIEEALEVLRSANPGSAIK